MPQSTQQVIMDSNFFLETDSFFVVSARRVGTPGLHRLLCHDDKEITVITTLEALSDVDIIARNKEQWRLFVINCANPFYCVGFLSAIAAAMTQAGLDILLTSTFSRDLVFVPQADVDTATRVLVQLGFKPRQRR